MFFIISYDTLLRLFLGPLGHLPNDEREPREAAATDSGYTLSVTAASRLLHALGHSCLLSRVIVVIGSAFASSRAGSRNIQGQSLVRALSL
jgi:hypothetical protein